MRRRFFITSLPALGLVGGPRPAFSLGTGEGSDRIGSYHRRLSLRLMDNGGAAAAAAGGALLRLHNDLRRRSGLLPLADDPELALAARAHAADLIARNYFAHAAPEGFTSRERVALLARRFIGASGENLAAEQGPAAPGPERFFSLWRGSGPHLENVLRARYTHAGFALLRREDRSVAAAVFGQRYGQLSEAAPFTAAGDALPSLLQEASAPLVGYRLEPPEGGADLGPFGVREPPGAARGTFLLRPEAADPEAAGAILVMYGPILQLL